MANLEGKCAYSIPAITYAPVIMPIVGGWDCSIDAFLSNAMPQIALAALLKTASSLHHRRARRRQAENETEVGRPYSRKPK